MSVNYKDTKESDRYTSMDPPDDRSTAEDRRLWEHLQGVKAELSEQDLDDAEQAEYLRNWVERNGDGSGSYASSWGLAIFALAMCGYALWMGVL